MNELQHAILKALDGQDRTPSAISQEVGAIAPADLHSLESAGLIERHTPDNGLWGLTQAGQIAIIPPEERAQQVEDEANACADSIMNMLPDLRESLDKPSSFSTSAVGLGPQRAPWDESAMKAIATRAAKLLREQGIQAEAKGTRIVFHTGGQADG